MYAVNVCVCVPSVAAAKQDAHIHTNLLPSGTLARSVLVSSKRSGPASISQRFNLCKPVFWKTQLCQRMISIHYPPEGEDLKKMVKYISQHKRLPATLPDHLRKYMSDYPRSFIPVEEFCTVCPGTVSLSRPILITAKAKILTVYGIIHGMSFIIFTFLQYNEVIFV